VLSLESEWKVSSLNPGVNSIISSYRGMDCIYKGKDVQAIKVSNYIKQVIISFTWDNMEIWNGSLQKKNSCTRFLAKFQLKAAVKAIDGSN